MYSNDVGASDRGSSDEDVIIFGQSTPDGGSVRTVAEMAKDEDRTLSEPIETDLMMLEKLRAYDQVLSLMKALSEASLNEGGQIYNLFFVPPEIELYADYVRGQEALDRGSDVDVRREIVRGYKRLFLEPDVFLSDETFFTEDEFADGTAQKVLTQR